MTVADRDQAAVIEALASADGQSLSYAELEANGVDRPACVGYELAAAGWPVSRTMIVADDGRRHQGLRMYAAAEGALEARATPRRWALRMA